MAHHALKVSLPLDASIILPAVVGELEAQPVSVSDMQWPGISNDSRAAIFSLDRLAFSRVEGHVGYRLGN
jgi:hypothetical protein